MLRIFTPILACLAFSSVALAHPEQDAAPKAPVKLSAMATPQLPSKSEIQEAIKQMPDMNALMGDMMLLMKDEKFRKNMESSARVFSDNLEDSGALDTSANGLPDMNSALAVMMETFSDEEAMGGMLDTMMGLATAMEKHIPESAQAVPLESLKHALPQE